MYRFFLIFLLLCPFSALSEKKPKEDSSSEPVISNLTEDLDRLNPKAKPSKTSKKNAHKKSIDREESLDNQSPRSLVILARSYEDKKDYTNQLRVLQVLTKKHKKNGFFLLELARSRRNLYFKTNLSKHKEEAVKVIDQVYKLPRKYREKAHLEMLELLKVESRLDKSSDYYFNIEGTKTQPPTEDATKESSTTETPTEEKAEPTPLSSDYAILKLLQTLLREFGVKKAYIKDICKYFYINQFYTQSLAGCKKAIKYDPKEPSNYVYYALSLKDREKKGKYLKTTVKKFPESVMARMYTGRFFLEEEEYKSALPHFKKVVRLLPNNATAHVGLARSLFHTKQEKASYKHFLKACILDKQRMLWAFKQAKSILNQKNRFKLADSFEKGITKCFFRSKK